MNIAIGFIIGVICYWLARIPAQSIVIHNKNREIKVPSHPRPLPKDGKEFPDGTMFLNSDGKEEDPILINISLENNAVSFHRTSEPTATVHEKSRLIEIETNSESMVFGFDNIKCLEYKDDVHVYWED